MEKSDHVLWAYSDADGQIVAIHEDREEARRLAVERILDKRGGDESVEKKESA